MIDFFIVGIALHSLNRPNGQLLTLQKHCRFWLWLNVVLWALLQLLILCSSSVSSSVQFTFVSPCDKVNAGLLQLHGSVMLSIKSSAPSHLHSLVSYRNYGGGVA